MDARWPPYPAITSEHVQGARLFANRYDQIAGLPIAKGGRVAEIGVWRTAFSKVLVDLLKPSQFVAFDIFTGHLETNWNGMTGRELFEGQTHRQFYEREMAPFAATVTIVEGDSRQTCAPTPTVPSTWSMSTAITLTSSSSPTPSSALKW